MSQVSLSPSRPPSFDLHSQYPSERLLATPSTRAHSQDTYPSVEYGNGQVTGVERGHNPLKHAPILASQAQAGGMLQLFAAEESQKSKFLETQMVDILISAAPSNSVEYSEHLSKIADLLVKNVLSEDQKKVLEEKLQSLADMLPRFVELENPAASKLYLVVEKCFDNFIQISTNSDNMELATLTIRFLTSVIMNLNYWELYNLLQWKPVIYQFLTLINYDINECYADFIKNYGKYAYRQESISESALLRAAETKEKDKQQPSHLKSSLSPTPEIDSSQEKTPKYYANKEISDDHDRFVWEQMTVEKEKPIPRERRKMRVDSKLAAHRIIKRAESDLAANNRSSNYDPDVIHECQLPSSDEPSKLCLRRFSRKYELIRHQETVHSKKKKLFKCFVCVKQDPAIGPRIFTRHDTLAKHIRVNHRISGKEAKAEVAYSKKHAEIVEEGDITVHVGRRKTKVDFELRAHMEKKSGRQAPDGSIIFDDGDSPQSMESGDDMDDNE